MEESSKRMETMDGPEEYDMVAGQQEGFTEG